MAGTDSWQNSELNASRALWMARLADAVYLCQDDGNAQPHEQNILAQLSALDDGFISVIGFDRNSAQGMLVQHEDYLALVFRGTDEYLDWFDNLRASTFRNHLGAFHSGFWHSTEDLWPEMLESLQQALEQKKRPLYLSGHSLGGAMATIMALRLEAMNIEFHNLYTFGQPRALSNRTAIRFNQRFKARTFRFQNNNDLVTRLPARIMGFRHAGNKLYISQYQTIYSASRWWYRLSDYLLGLLNGLRRGRLDSLRDHDIEDYLNAIHLWRFKP